MVPGTRACTPGNLTVLDLEKVAFGTKRLLVAHIGEPSSALGVQPAKASWKNRSTRRLTKNGAGVGPW